MALVAAVDGGWIIDHELSISAAYSRTHFCSHYHLKSEDGSKSCCYCCLRQFKSLPDLFAVYEPFRMESQYAKLVERDATKSPKTNVKVVSLDLVM
jgi:hypothetical protein